MGQSYRKPIQQLVFDSTKTRKGWCEPEPHSARNKVETLVGTDRPHSGSFSYQDGSCGKDQRRSQQLHNVETPSTFHTATPGYGARVDTPGRVNPESQYGGVLQDQKLLVAKEVETNWSGRGQHVEFEFNEIIPLANEKVIGHSATALIESVRCRRIRLARKSIRCNRRARLEDLVKEVSYLHKLRHPHIIQLVGTYFQKKTFAILLYRVATGDLTGYLEEMDSLRGSYRTRMEIDLAQFFFCLTHAVRYMHEQGVRHMDIKPSNILVNHRRESESRSVRSVYLADFGISKAFTEEDGSRTEGPAAMTKRWCSPEVAAQKPRGRAADIFSLGCVFSVMYTALLGASLTDYERDREESGEGDAFHLAIPQVKKWLDTFQEGDQGNWRWSPCGLFLNLLKEMISEDPEGRPPAGEVAERLEHGYRCDFDVWRCCSALPESYRFAEEGAMSTSFVSG